MLTASGCAAAGRELDQFFDITEIGGIVTKSIMLNPRSGRPTPRMAETPSGMLNSIGLQGPGIDAFLDKDLAWLRERGARAIVSIAGGSVDEYTRIASKLRHVTDIAAIEVNISCPNVESRGQVFACHPVSAAEVVTAVRRNTNPGIPVLAKLSPDVTDIVEIAQAVVKAGADGLSMINTLLGMVIDTDTMRPGARRSHGRAVRPGDPPGCRALRLPGARGHARHPHPRHGRHPHRARRPGVHPRGRHRAVSVGTVIFHDPRRRRCASRASSPWPSPSAASTACRTPSATPTARPTGVRSPGGPVADHDETDTADDAIEAGVEG